MKRRIFFFVAAVSAAVMAVSCGNTSRNSRETIGMEELAKVIEDMKSGDTLSVRGFCVDVCLQGANHITLVSDDSLNAINVIADGDLVSFDEGLKYSRRVERTEGGQCIPCRLGIPSGRESEGS